MRKMQFKRPEPGFSMYEGRTRGKRVKYTYSDNEDDEPVTDSASNNRRSSRNVRGHTPAAEPVVTASGRLVRPTRGAPDGAALSGYSTQGEAENASEGGGDMMELGPTGRPRRTAAIDHGTRGWAGSGGGRGRGRNAGGDEYDSDEDSEPELGDDEDEDEHVPDEESEEELEEEYDEGDGMDEDEDEVMGDRQCVITLKVSPEGLQRVHAKMGSAGGEDGSGGTKAAPCAVDGDGDAGDATNGRANEVLAERQSQASNRSVIGSGAGAEPAGVFKKLATPEREDGATKGPLRGLQGGPLTPGGSLVFRGSPERRASGLPPVGVGMAD